MGVIDANGAKIFFAEFWVGQKTPSLSVAIILKGPLFHGLGRRDKPGSTTQQPPVSCSNDEKASRTGHEAQYAQEKLASLGINKD